MTSARLGKFNMVKKRVQENDWSAIQNNCVAIQSFLIEWSLWASCYTSKLNYFVP